jgi:3-oxoisoapionate decarboxylase
VKLGLGTYAYMWAIGFQSGGRWVASPQPMTAAGLLAASHELGLHLVQYGPNLPLDVLPGAALDDLLSQARAWDIELELGTRGLETDHLASQIELAQRCGARLLRTVPELGGQTPPLAEIVDHLTAVVPLLEAHSGVRLGLENGRIPAADLCRVLDQVGSPLVGVVLDSANSYAVGEGWRETAAALARHTVCLHHKDFGIERVWHMMGFTLEGRPAGHGLLDTAWLLSTLAAARADFNVILEVWPPEQSSLTETIALEDRWVRDSIAYLREFVPN